MKIISVLKDVAYCPGPGCESPSNLWAIGGIAVIFLGLAAVLIRKAKTRKAKTGKDVKE